MNTQGLRIWTQESMAEYLNDAPKEAIERAVVRICQCQTNQIPSDAKTIAYMTKWILSGKRLTGKWIVIGRKLALKYRGQLVQVANERVIEKHLTETPRKAA